MIDTLRRVLILCLLACLTATSVRADDVQASADDWPQLAERKREVFSRLQEIQQELRLASRDEAQELIDEYNGLVAELKGSLYPQMYAAARDVLSQDELDDETANQIGDLAVRLFRDNKFERAAELADGVLAKAPENAVALNAGGAAHFALHNFERAAELLQQAEEQGKVISSVGGPYVDVAEQYIEYWEHEQSLRAAEAAAVGDEALPRVLFKTDKGDILLELFENEAPNTVANFISLVESGFYDGTAFHRVIDAFMAQGGDPNTREDAEGEPGTGGPGYYIACECYEPDARRHFAGSLSMAHAGRDTGGSQFFITHLPTPHLDAEVAPDSVHTVFGRVVEGMDVVHNLEVGDEIESATVVRKRNHPYEPETLPAE